MVVGLGNPGRRYTNSRHNAGFMAIDRLAARSQCRLRRSLRFRALLGSASTEHGDCLLVKPLTYMNRSGTVVARLLRARGIGVADLIVIYDDADLAAGQLRARARGGTGGHKGLASVVCETGHADFVRIRVGIGRGREGEALFDYVLKPVRGSELEKLSAMCDQAATAVLCVMERGVEAAMNAFNS